MHNAPSVVFPVGRFAWASHQVMLLAALVVCALVLAYGFAAVPATLFPWLALACVLTALGSACLSRIEWLHEGALAWDGQDWQCQSATGLEGPVQLQLVWDGGWFMLVSLTPRGSWSEPWFVRHALLRCSDMPPRWHGFRCAVYSRRMA